jgi:LmbE family N-acetylglucosaminyl deacetylase
MGLMLTGLRSATAQPLTGRPVIFVAPHPDDDILGFSNQLWRHVAAGRNIHILALTRGTATQAIFALNGQAPSGWLGYTHSPIIEGYSPLTTTDIGVARTNEQVAAMAMLGITVGRIHHADLQDGQVTVAQAKAAIVGLADQLGPDTGLWSLSYHVDVASDHLHAGEAVRQLGREQPARFYDRRYVVLRPYWNDPKWLEVPGRAVSPPLNETERIRTINAARPYGAWQPRSGAFAVANHSSPSLLAGALTSPETHIHRDG